MSPPPTPGAAWAWVVLTLMVAALVPLMLHWESHESASAAGERVEPVASPLSDNAVAAAAVGRGRVLIPEGAVTVVEGKPTVFVAERALRLLVATPVDLGARRGSRREILSGVSPGQMVVSDGASALQVMASR